MAVPLRGLERVLHALALQRDLQVLANLELLPNQRPGQNWSGSLSHVALAPEFLNARAAQDAQAVPALRYAKVETRSSWWASRSDATAVPQPVGAPVLQHVPVLQRGPACPVA